MDIFISWSGNRSKAVAELLRTWLRCVVQASKPWVSSQNISPGTVWFNQISDRLNSSSIGIVCLTQENKSSPWILFEAGALAKGLADTRVCTLLVDLTPTDIQPPLSMFNATIPNKEGIWTLVRQVNVGLKERALDEETLETAFKTYWPQFESGLQAALDSNPVGEQPPDRTQESILAEILQTTRGLSNRIDRLEGGMLDHVFSPATWALRDSNKPIFVEEGSRGLHDTEAVKVYQAKRDGSTSVTFVSPDQAMAMGIQDERLKRKMPAA